MVILNESTLEELILRIERNRELIFSDECERVLKCNNKKETFIRSEAWDHQRGHYWRLLEESFINSYLIESIDFAKNLFLKNLTHVARKEIKKHVKEDISRIRKVFREIYDTYHQKNNVDLSEILGILHQIDHQAYIRYTPVFINTGHYIPPKTYPEIEYELLRFREEILKNTKISNIEKAFHLHYQFVRIHPFADGNGRSARVWSNAYLYTKETFPLLIPLGEREHYMHLLDRACLSHRREKELTCLTREEQELFKYFAIKLNDEYEDYIALKISRKIS